MLNQYRLLESSKKKLINKISNLWFPIFFLFFVVGFLLAGFLFGFSIEETLSLTRHTSNAGPVFLVGLGSIPFAWWVAWALASLPFVLRGDLSFAELSTMLLKVRYPAHWLKDDL